MEQGYTYIWYQSIAYKETNGATDWIFEFPPRTRISRYPTPTLLWLFVGLKG